MAALSMGWMISPDGLRWSGNLAGHLGWWFPPVIVAVVALFMLAASRLMDFREPAAATSEPMASFEWATLGTWVFLAVWVSTGVLVSAGFAFNEIFYHRFPNFAFAFLLLVLLTALHLMAPQRSAAVQVWLMGAGLLGLTVLAVAGWTRPGVASVDGAAGDAHWSRVAATGLLFIGFDWGPAATGGRGRKAGKAMTAALIAGGLLMIGWTSAALHLVTRDRLADTAIPHLLFARAALDGPGRMIMGAVVIAGAAALLSALFAVVGARAATMASRRGRSPQRVRIASVALLAVTVGACMATGVAGSHRLEHLIYAGLIGVLGLYALRLAAAWTPAAGGPSGDRRREMPPLAAMTGAALILFWQSPDRRLTAAVLALLLFTALFAAWRRRNDSATDRRSI